MRKVFASRILIAVTLLTAICAEARTKKEDPLAFDNTKYTEQTLIMPDGESVRYRAYEGIFYVTHIADSVYQTLNIYVPLSAISDKDCPILLRTYVGGYRASKAQRPSGKDATGRALEEGYVVCIPGSRGWDSEVKGADGRHFTGRAPAGLVDLKAAIRYLRHNDKRMPGNAERIITDGTSAGGAMSALLGTSGNVPLFEPYLNALGAADERDDIFAAVCYCPIIDLEHADMAYEWLYACTNDSVRRLSPERKSVSEELAAGFPTYLESLQLHTPEGTPLTTANYTDYLKKHLIHSVQRALNEGCQLPEGIGISRRGEFVTDIDLPAYLNYVASTTRLKNPPAFDGQGITGNRPTAENLLFGDEEGSSANFTPYTIAKTSGRPEAHPDTALQQRIDLMNPMKHLMQQATRPTYWYIRHGARDRDTAFPIPINFATRLANMGYQVDFHLPWNRGHEGDYNLDDLFKWIKECLNTD